MFLKFILINVFLIFNNQVNSLRLVWCNQKQLATDKDTASILCEPRTDYATVNTTCTLFCPKNYDPEIPTYKCLPFGWFPNDAPKCTQNSSITLKIVPSLLGSIVLLFIISLVIAWYKKKRKKKKDGEITYDAEVGNWKAAKRRQYLKTNPALAKDLDNIREKSDNNELSRKNSEDEYDNVAIETELNLTEGNFKHKREKQVTELNRPVHKKRFMGIFQQKKKQKVVKNGITKNKNKVKSFGLKRKFFNFKTKFKTKETHYVSSSSYSFTSSYYTTSSSSDEYTDYDSKEEEEERPEESVLEQEKYSQVNKKLSNKPDKKIINSDANSTTNSKQSKIKSIKLDEKYEHKNEKSVPMPLSTSLTSVKKQENELIEKILFESLIPQDKLDESIKRQNIASKNYKDEKLKKTKAKRKRAHISNTKNKTMVKGSCYENSSNNRHILDFEKDYRRKEHRFDGNNYAPSISPVKYYPINPPIRVEEKRKKKRKKKQDFSNSTSHTGVKYIDIKPSHAKLKQEKNKGPSRYSPRKIVNNDDLLEENVVRVTRMKRKNKNTKNYSRTPKTYSRSNHNKNNGRTKKPKLKDNHGIPEEYQIENQSFEKEKMKYDHTDIKKSIRRKTNRQKKTTQRKKT